jgi:hypothetical protein
MRFEQTPRIVKDADLLIQLDFFVVFPRDRLRVMIDNTLVLKEHASG